MIDKLSLTAEQENKDWPKYKNRKNIITRLLKNIRFYTLLFLPRSLYTSFLIYNAGCKYIPYYRNMNQAKYIKIARLIE